MSTTKRENEISRLQKILQITFGLVPIIAGLDKFTNILTNWSEYLHPFFAELVGAETFMIIVGVIEIGAGILVFLKPKIGGYIVAAWLVGIVLNLLFMGEYLDVAVRDLVMAIAAFVLARLSVLNSGNE